MDEKIFAIKDKIIIHDVIPIIGKYYIHTLKIFLFIHIISMIVKNDIYIYFIILLEWMRKYSYMM